MKRVSNENILAALYALGRGETMNSVSVRYGIHHTRLRLLRQRYEREGVSGLTRRPELGRYSYEERVGMARDIEENKLSLQEASMKYDISYQTVNRLMRLYRSGGAECLRGKREMRRKSKESGEACQDEIVRLRRRVEYLEAENALLKKVRALAAEREARLRETGRRPSKG